MKRKERKINKRIKKRINAEDREVKNLYKEAEEINKEIKQGLEKIDLYRQK